MLNYLWGGNRVAQRVIHFFHLQCLPSHLMLFYKNLLKVPLKMLNLLPCRSVFDLILQESTSTYLSDNVSFVSSFSVSAHSISLPGEKMSIIPLLTVLPEPLKSFYSLEVNLVKTDLESWQTASLFHPRLCMPRKQYHLLLLRMFSLGMIKFLCKEEVRMVNGVHCVIKSNNKQRLIFDGRAVNSILLEPTSVSLPSFSLLEDWVVSKNETVLIAKLDIDNYYHRLGVPSWMIKYLVMPPISSTDLLMLNPTVSLPSASLLFPACITLPMGLSHAVLLAQSAHLTFISSLSFASLINTQVLPTAAFWCFVYIDDVIIVAKHQQAQKAKQQVNILLQQILQMYHQSGLVINQSKVLWASSSGDALGCTIDGIRGCVLPNSSKLCKLIKATKFLLTLPLVQHKWVEKLLGFWIWFLLLRRPLFSVLVNVYKFLHTVSTTSYITLWPSVAREFEILIYFSEFCVLDWRRINHSLLCATDASLLGAGACTLSSPLPPPFTPTQLSTLTTSFLWNTLLSAEWEHLEHINILEARAVVLALTQLARSSDCFHRRFNLLLDSQVVYYMLRKGRSSSFQLNCQMRRHCVYRLQKDSTRGSNPIQFGLQKAFDTMGDVFPENLDEKLIQYVELAPLSSRRSLSEKLYCAAKHFLPHLSLQLLGLSRFSKLLKKQFPSDTKPPMVEEVVLSVVAQLILMGWPTTALAVYTQFDLYLRPAELCAIQAHHLLFPGGNILGNFTGKVILVLPHTKTGPLQSVDVRLPFLHRLLHRLTSSASSTECLFPCYRIYAQRLSQALHVLKLSAIGYTPHSIRHGAATADLLRGGYQALPAILYRGRWESNAGKHYLQMGAALLLSAQLPPNFVLNAVQLKPYLEAMFNGVSLLPRK